MVLLHESANSKKFDVRMVDRNIAKGVLSPAELEAELKNLPDDAENASWVNVEFLSSDSGEVELQNGHASHQHH